MHRRVIFLPAAMLAMFNSYAQQQPQPPYTFKTVAVSDPLRQGCDSRRSGLVRRR